LSTLTKILIVLLTLSSIFLCGITVTYVGTANNYKEQYQDRNREIQSLKTTNKNLEQEVNKKTQTITDITSEFSSIEDELKQEISDTGAELQATKTQLAEATKSLENATIAMDSYAKTVAQNNDLREAAEEKLAGLEDLKITNENKIKQLTQEVVNLSATIDQLELEKKRLVEEKTKIQDDLNKSLQLVGLTSVSPTAITSAPGIVRPAPATQDINLEGVIMEIKPEASLAAINKGSAHGVRKQMRFHVIRNNEFICDIVISNVDADHASGYLDLVGNKLPKAGDLVKTNF